MKNREEYINSIYKKRDEALKIRKKRRSYLAAAACIAVCFLTAFFLVPQNKPKIKDEPNYSLGSTSDQFIITPEDFATLPAADGTVGFVEEAEGNLRENKTTAFFGGTDTEKAENIQSCTVASSVPQQAITSSTTKATKTTTKKNHSKNNTSKNDVVGAVDSIIDIEDVINGLDYILSDSIKWPEHTMSGNLLQGFMPEGLGSVPPATTKAPPIPDTGSDDLSGVLSVAHSYLSESELKEIDPSKTEIEIESSPLDSTIGSSSEICFVYYVLFQTDTKTIIIILDTDTLDFLGREEHPLAKQSEETTAPQTTAPESATTHQTTAISETTTVTSTAAGNN